MRHETGLKVYVLDTSKLEKQYTKLVKMTMKKNTGYFPEDIKLKVMGTWGYIKTPYGVYMLNRNGVGNPVPLSIDDSTTDPKNSVLIEFYCAADGVLQFGPVMYSLPSLTFIQECTVKEEMYLEDFILKLDIKSEAYFKTWINIFNKISNHEVHEALTEDGDTPAEYLEDSEDSEVKDYDEDDGEEVEYDAGIYDVDDTLVPKELTLEIKKKDAKSINSKEEVAKYSTFLVNKECNCRSPEVLVKVKENICSCGNKKKHCHCAKCGYIV